MIYFYFFSIITGFSVFISRKITGAFLFVGCCVALYTLPSTGLDYDHYKIAYENAYFSTTFPWFKTSTTLTAEPFYLWYSSSFRIISSASFTAYLVLNFIVCYILSRNAFRDLSDDCKMFFWVAFLPVIFPTLFYFSPRSSISFFLILFGLFSFIRNQRILATAFIIFGMLIHSQYLPIATLLILYNLSIFTLRHAKAAYRKKIEIVLILFVVVFMLNINSLFTILSTVLGILPSGDIATSKLHYFDDARTGFRLTSILSIAVYPVLSFLLLKMRNKGRSVFFSDAQRDIHLVNILFLSALFGMAINIIYFDTPHLSGRLSRFSDYISMGLILPGFLLTKFGRQLTAFVMLLMIIVSPVLYSTVYDFTY